MKSKKILRLTLLRKYFDAIASGKKKWEFREVKPYWIKKLEGKTYDEVHFYNGYSKDVPFMAVEFISVQRRSYKERWYYAIELGNILQMENYQQPKISCKHTTTTYKEDSCWRGRIDSYICTSCGETVSSEIIR